MFGTQGLWAGRNLYRATSAVTQGVVFFGLIGRTTPLFAFYDTHCDDEGLS
jgi:hypothetical protein